MTKLYTNLRLLDLTEADSGFERWRGSSGSLGMEVPIGAQGKASVGGLSEKSLQKLAIFCKLYAYYSDVTWKKAKLYLST